MPRPRLLSMLSVVLVLGIVTVFIVAVRPALADQPTEARSAAIAPTASMLAATFMQMAAGGGHTCAVTVNGGVQCWGLNTSGQLGNGNTDNRTKPTAVPSLMSGVGAVTAGSAHTCALMTNGGVKCWGNNGNGQLGVSTVNFFQTTPLDVTGLTSGVRAIAAAEHHTCALTVNGGVQCWGFNGSAQLGNDSHTSSNTPVGVSGLASGVSAIAVGGLHTCALTVGGGVKCWGDGATAGSTVPVDITGLTSGVSALAAGGSHTCVLLIGGGVRCWGDNYAGQLGDNTTDYRATPTDVVGLSSGVTALAAGGSHTCAMVSGGGVKCWGDNFAGQIGDGTATFRATPTDVAGLSSGVVAISAGAGHTCALLQDNAAKCWGDDFAGQLGDSATLRRSTPLGLPELGDGAKLVASGFLHSCLLTTGDGVECWGDNSQRQRSGQTSSGGTARSPVFSLRSGVTALALGFYHTCALTSIGAVQCWGSNPVGQLGDGTNISQGGPITVTGLNSGVNAIVTGGDHTCALLGTAVKCWGRNGYGQLGDNTTTHRATPVDVIGATSGIKALAAGGFHTCALTSSDGVKCWGRNRYGQLGDDTTTEQHTPVDVPSLSSGVRALAAADEHTCALLISGGVKCWGRNNNGQLGDGSTITHTSPVTVFGLDNGVEAVSVGNAHSCALTSTGAVQCWGLNNEGQLGDGSTTDSTTPVNVVGLGANVSAISTGNLHTCALTTSQQIFCWGSNHAGQVGDSSARQLTPVDVLADAPPAFTCGAVIEIPQTECAALVALYASTDGANWITKTNWLVTHTPCSWYGITCGQGSVTELKLEHNRLNGSIPPELGNLSNLMLLYLYENQLRGTIPSQLGNLGKIHEFYLHTNQLTGSIPTELGNLGDVMYLYLSDNQLSGVIPPSLGNLTKLKNLELYHNALSGSIPPQIGNLVTLETLYLMENQLSGPLPAALGNLSNLTHLYVYDNQLSGALPAALTGLTKLAFFRFQNTAVCEPQNPVFQTWLTSIANLVNSGIACTPAAGDAYEEDNSCAQAAAIASDGTLQPHNFHASGDADWLTFTASAGAHYLVRADIPNDSVADVTLELYAACDTTPLDEQGYDFTPGVQLEFVAPSTGPLFLKLTNSDTNRAGADVRYELSVRQLSAAPTTSALILVAGGIGGHDAVKPNIYHVTDQVRSAFLKNGYQESQIRYLAADASHVNVTAAATVANLQQAISEWAVSKVVSDGALTLYLMDHGGQETFYLDKAQNQVLTPAQLDAWLTVVETAHPGVKINVIIEACYAGSFISGPQTVSKAGRVVIASTRDDFVAWASSQGAIFSDYFLAELERKASLDSSFQHGWAAARAYHTTQTAWLDGNGDGVPNEPADRAIAAERGFGITGSLPSDEWPPYIVKAEGPITIHNGVGELRAEVLDDKDGVKQVWAVIYPPSYTLPDSSEALVRDDQNPVVFSTKLIAQGNDQYSISYPAFTAPGLYRVVLYAEDDQGLTAQPVPMEITIGNAIFLPFVTR